jgi:hypothetical protein
MALNNYTALKAAIANWTGRSDIDASGVIDDGIALLEAEINRTIRHRLMINRLSGAGLTVTAGYLQHPTDFIEWVRISNQTTPRDIEPISENALDSAIEKNYSGNARFSVVYSTETLLIPTQANALNLEAAYYAFVPPLGGVNATNWLLTKFPDVYLAGSIMKASVYSRDDPRAAQIQTLYSVAMQQLDSDNNSSRFSGGTLAMKQAR